MRSPRFSVSVMVLIASLGLAQAGCNSSPTAPSSGGGGNGPDVPGHNPSTGQLSPPPVLEAGSGVKIVATQSTPQRGDALAAGKRAYVVVDVEGTCHCTVMLKIGAARSASATWGGEVSHGLPFDNTYTPVVLKGAPERGVSLGTIASGSPSAIEHVWIGAWVLPGTGTDVRIQGSPAPDAQFTFFMNWRAQ